MGDESRPPREEVLPVGSLSLQVHLQPNRAIQHLPHGPVIVICNPSCNHRPPKTCPRTYSRTDSAATATLFGPALAPQ
jgi:hypothetical protein